MKTQITKTGHMRFNFIATRVFAIAIFLCLITANATAQDSTVYKKIRVDIGFGAPDAAGQKLEGLEQLAGLIYIEPNYAINDNFAVGLRYMEAYAFSYDGKEVSDKYNNVFLVMANFRTNGFNLARWDYKNSTRLVAGLGIGINNYHNKIDTTFFGLPIGEKVKRSAAAFAFMPRLGFEAGKFTMDVNYTYTGNRGANFIAIELGFYLGGGKKNK